MTLREHDLGQIAEWLAVDFDGQVPFDVMIIVLRECIAKHPAASPEQIEQVVRIQLQIRRQGLMDASLVWPRDGAGNHGHAKLSGALPRSP